MARSVTRSVADIDTFITMLRVACEDVTIHAQLERILEMPDDDRRRFVDTWVRDMLSAEAPRHFIEAIGCLLDDRVAEKAYEVIFNCPRGEAR